MHGACMATKTISIDLEAYERLRAARCEPKESFSRVIKRAEWHQSGKTCGSLLADMKDMPAANEDVLKRLEQAQGEDAAPDNAWS
jgi:Uncharacterized conserved protein